MTKLFFSMKEEHKRDDGKYTEYAQPIDFFTNWIYDNVMSDDFYDDEDRKNCYFELNYMNYSKSIKTRSNSLVLPIDLLSASLLCESEWENVKISLYTIIDGEKEEIPCVPSFYEFMAYVKGLQKAKCKIKGDRGNDN